MLKIESKVGPKWKDNGLHTVESFLRLNKFAALTAWRSKRAEHLGFEEYIPTFSLRGQDILRGVNYASGSAGIQFETGHHLGARISMDKQLQNHILTIGKLAKMMRGSHWRYLEECLYTVTIGNNDYINNYLVPKYYPSSLLYSHQQFAQLLLDQFSFQLQALHGLGARKVAVFGLGLIGCTLAEISRHGASPGSPCVDPINEAVQHFNNGLASLVTRLNANLKDATFTFINSTSIALLTTPHSPGKMVSDIPCCKLREDGQCAKFVPPCHNQDKYVFWDGFHPTEAMNIATAARAYKAQFPTDAYPVDISRLISHTVAAE